MEVVKTVRLVMVPGAGVEPARPFGQRILSPLGTPVNPLQNQGKCENEVAPCAIRAQVSPPELAEVIDAWLDLPSALRAAVLAIVHFQ